MFKKVLVFLVLLLSLPTEAGVLEAAVETNNPVFLYLYTPECSYCKKFDSKYNKIRNKHTEYKYIKLNANQAYGNSLMRKYHGGYVPYIVLISKKLNKSAVVSPMCAMDDICVDLALKGFLK